MFLQKVEDLELNDNLLRLFTVNLANHKGVKRFWIKCNKVNETRDLKQSCIFLRTDTNPHTYSWNCVCKHSNGFAIAKFCLNSYSHETLGVLFTAHTTTLDVNEYAATSAIKNYASNITSINYHIHIEGDFYKKYKKGRFKSAYEKMNIWYFVISKVPI